MNFPALPLFLRQRRKTQCRLCQSIGIDCSLTYFNFIDMTFFDFFLTKQAKEPTVLPPVKLKLNRLQENGPEPVAFYILCTDHAPEKCTFVVIALLSLRFLYCQMEYMVHRLFA